MAEHVVAATDEIAPGERIVVQVEGREVAVFNIDGEYRAYTNWCLHQGGPVCEGTVSGTSQSNFDRDTLETTLEWIREGEILSCPWHGWEYDVMTGECLSRAGRLVDHDVEIEDGNIVVSV